MKKKINSQACGGMFSYLKLHLHHTYRKHLIVLFICSSHHWKKIYISQVCCSMFTFYHNLSSYRNRYVHYYLKKCITLCYFLKIPKKIILSLNIRSTFRLQEWLNTAILVQPGFHFDLPSSSHPKYPLPYRYRTLGSRIPEFCTKLEKLIYPMTFAAKLINT